MSWSPDTLTDAAIEDINRRDVAQARRIAGDYERDFTDSKELAAALKENERLSKLVTHWKEQTKLTKQPTIDADSVAELARSMMKQYDAKDADVADGMTELYNALLRGEIEYDEAHKWATEIAMDLVDHIAYKDSSCFEMKKTNGTYDRSFFFALF